MKARLDFSANRIEAEYQRLGHQLGWRLFTCPVQNIETATTALITINPGGSKFEPACWEVKSGSAYVIESWKQRPPGQEKLQRQVQRMFQIINIDPKDVLSGYLVPFRSRNWKLLPHKIASLDFGKLIWREIFDSARVKHVFAFGKEISEHVTPLLSAMPCAQLSAGWGNQTIDIFHFRQTKALVVLPHLSHFALFNRTISEAAFGNVMRHLDGPHSRAMTP